MCMVVWNILFFQPYLGKIPILINIFQLGWNQQLQETNIPQLGKFGKSSFLKSADW